MSQHSSKGRGWEKKRQQVISSAGGLCAYCGAEDSKHVDHIVPKAVAKAMGWTEEAMDDLSNLQLLCEKHNLAKGSKVLQDRINWVSPRVEAHMNGW